MGACRVSFFKAPTIFDVNLKKIYEKKNSKSVLPQLMIKRNLNYKICQRQINFK